MKRFIQGANRDQLVLMRERLDDFVDEENSVRVIDAYVESLDLGHQGFEGVTPCPTGRPGYRPSVLLHPAKRQHRPAKQSR